MIAAAAQLAIAPLPRKTMSAQFHGSLPLPGGAALDFVARYTSPDPSAPVEGRPERGSLSPLEKACRQLAAGSSKEHPVRQFARRNKGSDDQKLASLLDFLNGHARRGTLPESVRDAMSDAQVAMLPLKRKLPQRNSNPKALRDAPKGYRLRWNRWMIGVVRGDRRYLIVEQLPFKTSDAGGGGVPLSQDECDAVCPKYLTGGEINLTDGAAPYEAFAAGDIACSPNCERKDCLLRAMARGESSCNGWRPRGGRASHRSHYAKLRLAHGVVAHVKKEWALVKKVRVFDAKGKSHLVDLKHGAEVADGAWSELKRSYPRQVHSGDETRLAEYVNAWAWKARRHGSDIFRELGAISRA